MKVKFDTHTFKEQIVPQDDFVIEKVVEISERRFNKFLDDMLGDYDFIKEHMDLMYTDSNNIWHAILVTTKDLDYGILVQAEGSSYARHSAFIRKSDIGGLNNGKSTNA
jgi:hypothetical protein